MLAISFLIANLLVFSQGDGERVALGSLATRCMTNGTYRSSLWGKWQVTTSCTWHAKGATLWSETNYLLAIFSILHGAEGAGTTSLSSVTRYASIAPYRASL